MSDLLAFSFCRPLWTDKPFSRRRRVTSGGFGGPGGSPSTRRGPASQPVRPRSSLPCCQHSTSDPAGAGHLSMRARYTSLVDCVDRLAVLPVDQCAEALAQLYDELAKIRAQERAIPGSASGVAAPGTWPETNPPRQVANSESPSGLDAIDVAVWGTAGWAVAKSLPSADEGHMGRSARPRWQGSSREPPRGRRLPRVVR